MSSIEDYKLMCSYAQDFASTLASEIVYFMNKLNEPTDLKPHEEVKVRDHILEKLNTYLGLFVSPDGMCSRNLARIGSDPKLKNIVDCKKCEVRAKYFELSKKYRESHSRELSK